ncbi:MAG: PfkB family carbohydrate kinase, partial [Dongiaceae bacterium]
LWRGWAASGRRATQDGLVQRASQTVTALVLTLGGDGLVLLVPGSAPRRLAAVPAAVRDSTGAGDVFAGTFLAAWLNGEAPDRAARHGAAAAALSTEGLGALGHLPTAAAVRDAAARAGAAFANLWG